ncbi:phage tail fiber protein [Salmonella enterica]|uniref:Phage tail protein n=1 Tax=Salmonella enterica TaxID=28901 RepID=A0A764X8L2_SALER|nr:phage tail protein [Salmonella enterica subsp. enterica serovar Newport]EFN2629797.1 phage tail protein [Salmonella enterica subsp. enterica serovar Albany]EGO0462046.1 phage tail protein [Salmonella enterica]ECO1349891.1 phage tail protein [Salmonella enterica subsp. enterica serovar Newport]EFN2634405.1 phage tail protein [Salmonella enterica subsp. enterica serovar Albany]
MSVPNQTPYIIYNANGLTTVFPFEFYVISASDIQVSINGTTVTSGYSVSGTGNVGGGDVTFITPPASGAVVMIERVVPTYRLTDYQDNGDLLADTVNKDFDRLWMAIQRSFIYLGLALRRPILGGPFNAEGYRISNLADPVNTQDAATKSYVDNVSIVRALRVPEVSVSILPPADQRANKLLAFNSFGQPIAVLPESGSAADVLIELAKPYGYTYIGGLVEIFSLPVKFVVVDNAPYNGDLKAALTAATSGSVFWLGKKTYNITGLYGVNRNTVENITIVGAGMPKLSSDKRYFIDGTGTIIQGTIKNQARGFKIFNLGIDVGDYVSQSVYPTVTYEDGLQHYGVGSNANLEINNVKFLNTVTDTAKPGTHSLLLEQLSGVKLGYVECIGGFHGFTVKCQGLQGGIAHCYGQYGDAFIFKSDSGGACADNYMERITVGLYDNSGWPDVTMGGIYDAHDNVTIDKIGIGELIVQNASWGLIPSDANTGFITNVSIGRYSAFNVYGNYYSLTIDNRCVGWTIGEHRISNASGGIRVHPDSVEINIGTGSSKGNTESGYALGGNSLSHGIIFANENGKYGVDYLGGVGLDASLIRGFTNGFGLVSALPSARDGNPLNGWADTGTFDMPITGKTVSIIGSLTRGTAAVAYKSLSICQPRKRVPIPAFGTNASGTRVPVECYMETDGSLNVVGFASIPTGGTIDFNGDYLCK